MVAQRMPSATCQTWLGRFSARQNPTRATHWRSSDRPTSVSSKQRVGAAASHPCRGRQTVAERGALAAPEPGGGDAAQEERRPAENVVMEVDGEADASVR